MIIVHYEPRAMLYLSNSLYPMSRLKLKKPKTPKFEVQHWEANLGPQPHLAPPRHRPGHAELTSTTGLR